MLMAAGILVAVVGSAVAWLHGDRYASTDDAYIQAGKLRRMFLVWCRR
jgi:multidrug resistance efflux pump